MIEREADATDVNETTILNLRRLVRHRIRWNY
jgi:hypothetical protein